MNPIRSLRKLLGITQNELAMVAKTSQPTIALYESGEKSPTVATLERLAFSQGFELIYNYVPLLTRTDRRSLAYHEEIAFLLKKDFQNTLERANKEIEKMSQLHPGAIHLFTRWQLWLTLPVDDLISRIMDPGLIARDMRQVSPFSGLIKAKDRARILREFRKENAS